MKEYEVVLLDTQTNEYLDGFRVFARDQYNARLLAHTLKVIRDDWMTGRYFVYSTMEVGKPETKKVYCTKLKDETVNLTILS